MATHAFDLSTSSRAYWCDGILVHNCVRDGIPRADLTQDDLEQTDDGEGDQTDTSSIRDPLSASDQAAFDLFLRSESAARGTTIVQEAARFGRLERTGRLPRVPRGA